MQIMTVGDKSLIVLIILLSITSIFYIMRSAIEPLEKDVIVLFDGLEVAKVTLNTGKQLTTYNFEFGENTGTLETINGRVRMLPMGIEICPKEICSDTGWIKNSYQLIACLPNKLIVTIETSELQDIDIILN